MKFTEFNLPQNLLRAIESCNYTDATAIQEQTIPALMNGHDIIGQSQTGTGKTAAFALPILAQCVPTDHKRPQALILSPTRELALQIVEHFRQFTKFSDGIRTVAIYGGQPIDVQIRELKKGGDIIVGTPGRIQDHIRRKTLRFENLNYLVLDEADEMLQMGFKEEIEEILKSIPEARTTALFSATMPKAILDITENYMKNPQHISISPKMKTLDAIEQMVYEVPQPYKVDLLLQLIALYQPTQAMIFCNTKKMVDDLAETLQKNHLDAAAIHGDMEMCCGFLM
ncbi:MAG: DEAD/DEAH box helicase [Erysipelothrix sp.]|nr:DEAD/DEAH box helicase [Erysipelothrix sp.]